MGEVFYGHGKVQVSQGMEMGLQGKHGQGLAVDPSEGQKWTLQCMDGNTGGKSKLVGS